MTTVKELSEQLGVSKTAILAYCKDELHLHTEPRKALQLSANDCAAVCSRFADENSQRAAVTQETENKVGSDGVQMSAQEFAELKTRLAVLEERCAGYERTIAALRERAESAEGALEREQMQARGFWSRLGQKLLKD